jgi:hypothetical protein
VASHSAFGCDCLFRQLHHSHGARLSQNDYRKLPDEDRVTDALRSTGVTRGPAYFFPYFSFKEMKSAPVVEQRHVR